MSIEGFRQPTTSMLTTIVAVALWVALSGCSGETESPFEAPPRHVDAGPTTLITAGGSRSFVSYSHSCAIVDDGVQCWGANGNGQLGDGFVTLRVPVPSRVTGLDRGVTAIAAGGSHTCAIRSGSVLCWGKNHRRQIGTARPAVFPEPTEISGLPDRVTGIAAGDEHSCAIARGELFCWGRGTGGELGKLLTESCGGYRAKATCSSTPIHVDGLGGHVTHVALGSHHSCAIVDEQIYCWGRNDRGQLGVANRIAPNQISDQPLKVAHSEPATAIAAGAFHTCALIGSRVWCWGAGDEGQLGDGAKQDRDAPVPVASLAAAATHVSAGARHSCAVVAGQLSCWGSNSEGQLGQQNADLGPSSGTPVAVTGFTEEITSLASGADHSCAAQAGGTVSCWGANDFGQLGNGHTARSAPPATVTTWDRGIVRDRDGDGRITVVCLGDSNTQLDYLFDRTWCERLEPLLNQSANSRASDQDLGDSPAWVTLNRGWGGATAISLPSLRRAEEQLAYTLEFDSPDVVILAYGTNDLLQHATPEDVLLASVRNLLRAREWGVDSFIALVPPAHRQSKAFDAAVESTNALIRRAVRADRIIDFASGLTKDDFLDDVHLNHAGQIKRASAALAALRPAQ